MNKFEKLPPFKFFALQSFPFIEYDFDAMTNYELICKVAEYLKTVAAKTNENVQDIQNLVQWIQSLDLTDEVNAKLDEMAQDGTLARIINEDIFNELNTIVQKDTVLLNDKCEMHFPFRGENAGDAIVIQNAGKNILIDLGVSITPLINWLSNKGITKIDYIIISHYHADHIAGSDASGFATLLDSDVVDCSNAVVYLPHKGIDWTRIQAQDKQILIAAENTIKQKCTAKGIQYIEPDNNQLLVLSEICKLKFLNIGSTFYNSYYGTYSEYNNFSMVVELQHINRYALFTGDISKEAQANIASLIHEPDLLKTPHHDLENIADTAFLKKCTSKIMVFMEFVTQYGCGLTTPFAQAIKNNGGKIYDSNVCHDVYVLYKNDNIISSAQNGIFSLSSTGILNASGIHLTENTDLNDIRTNGNYYTNTYLETASLQHLPLAAQYAAAGVAEGLGRCQVVVQTLNNGNDILNQYFIIAEHVWIRSFNNDHWTNWKNMSGDSVLDTSDSDVTANSDLDDYFKAGKYIINNNTVYETIAHVPAAAQGGSILLVLSTRRFADIVHQVLICATGRIFKRTLSLDAYSQQVTQKSNWFELNKTEIQA